MQTFDIIIFAIFFVVNLVVGIRSRGKKQSFNDFAVGNKDFSTATLVATIVATWASGSMFFSDLEQTYTRGLYFIIAILIGAPAGLLFAGYVMAPRMQSFFKHVSMADAMGGIYGRGVQFVTAVSATLSNIALIAIQYKVISKILITLFNISGDTSIYVTVLAAALITFYSAFGGLRAVTFTDIIQFITFGTFLPALALTIFHNIQNPGSSILAMLATNPNFSLSHVLKWDANFMPTFKLLCYLLTAGFAAPLFQRMAMARDLKQVQHSIGYATIILMAIHLFTFWIAILLLADKPGLAIDEIVGHMIDKHTYVGLKGFLGIGVIALAMSTADSCLHSSSVLIANDILPSIRLTKGPSVYIAAVSTFVLGFLATLLSLTIQNILQLIFFAANFYVPIITMPVLLTIFGFKTTPRVMLIGMAAGTIVTAVILIYYKHVDAFFPGIFANLAFLLGSHYLLQEKRRLASRVLTVQRLMGGVSTWEKQTKELHKFKLLPYIKEHLPSQQYFYPLLALYLISSSYFALYCVPYHMQAHYSSMYRFTQFSILYIVPSLILFFMWPIRLRETRFLAWLLPSVLLYAFFFLGAIIVFMSGFAPMPMAMFMMHLLMTMTVTSWPLVVSLATIGITLAVLLFNYCFGEIILAHTFSIPFIIGYSCFVLSSALIVVRRFNENHRMRKHKEKHAQTDLLSTIQDVLQYLTVEERFNTAWQVKDMQALEKAATVTHQLSNKIVELEQRITSSQVHDEDLLATKAKLEKAAQTLSLLVDKPTAYTKPHFEKLSVKQMIQQTAMQLYFDDIVEEPNITLRLERNMEHQTVNVDIAKMKDLFHHALFYTLHALSDQRRKIIVSVAGSELTYPLRSGEAQQRVSAVCITITTLDTLPELLPAYESNIEDALWDVPLTFTTLPLFSAKQILKGSHSYMAIDRTGHDAITQVYVIPQDMCEGRLQATDGDAADTE